MNRQQADEMFKNQSKQWYKLPLLIYDEEIPDEDLSPYGNDFIEFDQTHIEALEQGKMIVFVWGKYFTVFRLKK